MTDRRDHNDISQAPAKRATELDSALIALARLLGRQAAREVFNREKESDDDHLSR